MDVIKSGPGNVCRDLWVLRGVELVEHRFAGGSFGNGGVEIDDASRLNAYSSTKYLRGMKFSLESFAGAGVPHVREVRIFRSQ